MKTERGVGGGVVSSGGGTDCGQRRGQQLDCGEKMKTCFSQPVEVARLSLVVCDVGGIRSAVVGDYHL